MCQLTGVHPPPPHTNKLRPSEATTHARGTVVKGQRSFPVLSLLAQWSGEISPLSLSGEETWLANIQTTNSEDQTVDNLSDNESLAEEVTEKRDEENVQ